MIQLLLSLFISTESVFKIMDLLDLFKIKLNEMLMLVHEMSETDQSSAMSLWEKVLTSSQGFLPHKGGSIVQNLFSVLEFVGGDNLMTNVTPFEESGDADDVEDVVQEPDSPSVGLLPMESGSNTVNDGIITDLVSDNIKDRATNEEQEEKEQETSPKAAQEVAPGQEDTEVEAGSIAQSLQNKVVDTASSMLADRSDPEAVESAAEIVADPDDAAVEGNSRDSQDGKMKKTVKTKKAKKEKRTAIKQTKEEKCTCGVCGKELANPSNLRVHSRIHNGARPYKCSICDKSFSIRPNMRRHEKTHTGEKPWECSQCLKRFTEKKSLKVHFRSHTGEKPFECKDCGKCFTQAGTLQSHRHVHTGWKGHLCDFCGKSFRQKSQLRLHEFRHTNNRRYICQVCTRSFISKGELDRHSMQHTGEKPYLCTLCPKMFTRLTYLKEHMNSHTGQKLFLCPHCSETFSERSEFTKHVKTHKVTSKSANRNTQQMELHCADVQFGERDTYLLYISTPQGLATLPSSSQMEDVIGGIDDTAEEDAIISVPGLTVDDFDDAQQVAGSVMATSDVFESSLGPSEEYVFVKTEDQIQGEDATDRYAVVELLQTTS